MGWRQLNGGLNLGDCLIPGLIHDPNRDFSTHDYSIHGDLIRYGLIHPVRSEAFAAVCGLFSCSY